MALPINFPITTEAVIWLFRHSKVKSKAIFPTDEYGIYEMTAKTWKSLALEDRPCTWCGEIMGYNVAPCGDDICADCAHPDGEGC